MAAGCVGLIFGRNTWQRKWDQALSMASQIHDVCTGKDYGQQQDSNSRRPPGCETRDPRLLQR